MEKSWETLEQACLHCQKCSLCQTRTNVVIGKGNPKADILFVGEGPGQQEDLTGVPFVGAAGQLLDKMLAAISLSLDDVYIANIVKCRPPYNRDPRPEEQKACMNYLRYQFALIRPKMIVCLGRIAACAIISPDFRITKQHGEWTERKGCWITATFHPSALLRDERNKRPTWEDLKKIKQKLEELKQNDACNSCHNNNDVTQIQSEPQNMI